jgi:uncharacterized membrane protein YbhN (UPF0104 family)
VTDVGLAEERPSVLKVVARVALIVGALVVSGIVLFLAFDDLDPAEIGRALRSLEDAEIVALASTWLVWIAAQGLQTSSLVHHLPVRRGVVAYLGPSAVASAVPGPSDFPVRYRMLTSWGYSLADATLAVAAGGVFNIGIKLVLPVIAAVGLLVSGSPIEGTLRTIVAVALLIGVGLAAVAAVLASEERTQRIGRLLDPIWRAALRRLRRPAGDDLGARLVESRARALHTLRARWPIALWGTFLTALTRFGLLLLSVRSMGLTDEMISWPQVFVAYALVEGLTVIPITAGNAGVSEVAMVSFLTASAGAAAINEVTAAVILFRLLTWLLIIPVGLVALAVWRRSVGQASNYGARR